MEQKSDVPPLCEYLDDLVAELQRLVPLALRDWEEKGIHQSRVSTRRLKAGVDLFRPVLSDDARGPFTKLTRRLRRRLGPLRDLDVMLGHLEELAKHGRHTVALTWLADQLRVQREKAREESLEDAPPARVLGKLATTWSDVRGEIIEATAAVDSLLVESIHLQLDAFAEQADRLIRSSDPSGAPTVPQDVHQLRIAGKALRYTLEMAREHGRPLESRVMRTFKRMQDALGLWHDFVVMTEWAMRASLEGLLAHHDTKLQADVLALARLTLARAEQKLKRFGVLWAKEGPNVVQTIRTRFPITQPAIAPGTDPGPSATAEPSAPAEAPTDAAPAA
ncbi:MAG: CHAD domain-containing protein [Tepidisphaeraceae bacterium]